MVAPITESPGTNRFERIRETLNTILETLVQECGMEPDDAGSLMVDAGNSVAGEEGEVYLFAVMREIEQRAGISLLYDKKRSQL